MKKFILLLSMLLFLSTNIYAEELHYHKEMWCLNPDGTPAGTISKNDYGSIDILDENGAGLGSEDYKKTSLQEVFKVIAEYYGIPAQIPSKKTDYNSEKIPVTVTVEPVSATQIYMYIQQDGGEDSILMTYNPATKTTHKTTCFSLP